MHTSASNAFYGRVTRIRHSDVFSEICLTAQNGYDLVSVITRQSFAPVALQEGLPVTALVKAPDVLVARPDQYGCPTKRNCFPGRVTAWRSDGVATEILGELDGGTPMCALITTGSAERLDLRLDAPLLFFFKAFAVILSAE